MVRPLKIHQTETSAGPRASGEVGGRLPLTDPAPKNISSQPYTMQNRPALL